MNKFKLAETMKRCMVVPFVLSSIQIMNNLIIKQLKIVAMCFTINKRQQLNHIVHNVRFIIKIFTQNP